MKERSIRMTGPEVRAILAGNKTQKRIVMKPQPETNQHGLLIWWRGGNGGQLKEHNFRELIPAHCPYGRPGDRLWVRETHKFENDKGDCIFYKADGVRHYVQDNGEWLRPEDMWYWRPSIHMPRWASRITLEVESVRVERLQDISEEDAKAEGIEFVQGDEDTTTGFLSHDGTALLDTAKRAYYYLWESINGIKSWERNEWVWAITFRRIEQLD